VEKSYFFGLAIPITLLFGTGAASAGQIVLTFSGTINDSIDNTSSISLLGLPFSGSLSYDSNDPILFATAPPLVTTVYSFGPPDFLTLTIGSFTFSASGSAAGNELAVEYHQINGVAYDSFEMAANLSSISSNFPGFLPTLLEFGIAGTPGLLIAPGLPQNFNFSDVVSNGFGFRPTDILVAAFPPLGGSAIDAFGANQFTSLQIQTTPEPATVSLLAFGLLGLVLMWKRGHIGTAQR
jgi:hypothetical protein